jgi:hypothetical protein
MQQKTFSTLDRNDGINVFLSSWLAGSLLHVVAAGFPRTPRRLDRPETCRILATDGTLQAFDTPQELCACLIWLLSLTPCVKAYVFPPCVMRNIALHSFVSQSPTLRQLVSHWKLHAPGAATYDLRRHVFNAIAFRRMPVLSVAAAPGLLRKCSLCLWPNGQP